MNYADRVRETTNTVGTSPFILGGAVEGYRAFGDAHTTGSVVAYCVSDGTEWEVGLGTLTAPTTLARTTVLASSNAGAAVSFGTGAKDIFETMPAALASKLAAPDSPSTSTIADPASSTLLIEEGGTVKRITLASLMSSMGSSQAQLTAAGALTDSDIISLTQDGTNEVRTTLAALKAYMGTSGTVTTTVTGVTISPTNPTVAGGASQQFTATVSGTGSPSQAVTWSCTGVGSISASGLYTAPSATASTQNATVTATSSADSTKSASTSITVPATGSATITVTTPAAQTAGTAFTVSGTYTGTAPTALDYSLDGGTTWAAASSPTIGGGNYSFSLTINAANASQTVRVRDHNNTAVSGASGTFTVSSSASTSYTLTPYSSNALKASSVAASTGATGTATTKRYFTNAALFLKNYWNISPTPASAVSGWGTSNTVAPSTITQGSNQSGDASVNGMTPMTAATAPSWQMNALLWVDNGSGDTTWYYWIKPVDGVAQCVAGPLTITGA